MLPKERIQIALLFTGMFCLGWGFVLLNPLGKRDTLDLKPPRTGVFKDGGLTAAGGRVYAPWVIGIGMISFVGYFAVRARD